MRRAWAVWARLVAALAAAALVFGGTAAAQRVTIDVENVPLEEAIEELEEQTGYQIDTPRGGDIAFVTIHAEDRPLKEALRSACEQAGYRFRRLGMGPRFMLEPGQFRESPYAAMVEGYKVSVERLTLERGSRMLTLTAGEEQFAEREPSLRLELQVEAPTDEEGRLIHGVDDLELADGAGGTYGPPGGHSESTMHGLMMPDTARGSMSFEPPAADVQQVSVKGTLVLYESAEPVEFRFNDLSAMDVTQEKGGLRVTLREMKVEGGSGAGRRPVLPPDAMRGPVATRRERARCELRMQVEDSEGSESRPRRVEMMARAGAVEGVARIRWVDHGGSGRWGQADLLILGEEGEIQRFQGHVGGSSYGFSLPEGEEPTAIVFRAWRRKEPERRIPFRIDGVPVP